MKNTLTLKNLPVALLTLIVCLISACSKNIRYDITGDTVNRVYINTATSYINNYTFPVIHTPAGSIGNIIATFPVRCTLESAADLKVNFAIDNSLVDSFNKANSATYKVVPDGLVTLSTNALTIPKGALISGDSLTIAISGNLDQLTDEKYLIPVKITAISSTNNTAISSNLNTVYVMINTSTTNCYDSPESEDMVGNLIADRSAWTATLNVPSASGTFSRMFDGNTRSYWLISPSVECVLTVDLGAGYTNITGIRIHSYRTSYSLTSAIVSTSSNGNNWDAQGNANFSTSSSYQYIKFYAPVTARYLKLDITGWKSAADIVLAEYDVYTN